MTAKTALVTGANGGLGTHVTKNLAECLSLKNGMRRRSLHQRNSPPPQTHILDRA